MWENFDTLSRSGRDRSERGSRNTFQPPRRGPGRKRPLNFEKYAEHGNRFVNEVMEELRCGRSKAARVTRAVLHAIRDRIPPDDAIEFAQGLPMALKGVFIDQYDISAVPLTIRKREDFVDYVHQLYGPSILRDFPHRSELEEGIRAVFFVLSQNMDYGQTEQIRNLLPEDIRPLLGTNWPVTARPEMLF